MPQASTSAIVVDGASNAQRGSSRDVRPNSRQQDTPVSLAMRITAAVIVVLIVINVLVFAYASIVSAAEPPLRGTHRPARGATPSTTYRPRCSTSPPLAATSRTILRIV
ncbi:hypothetical protein MTO96_047244 [Rhipicephalus appendiculatus]